MSDRLKIAVVHYHFKPGGVTRVAQSTLSGFEKLSEDIQFGFISGPPGYSDDDSQSRCLDELGYTSANQTIDPEALYFSIIGAAREIFDGLPDVWHIHNHSLGKNKAFAGVVRRLAADGRPLLLHIHDFAEDGRPSNYAHIQEGLESPEDLYPIGEHIHYALLNGRDFAIMREAGIPASNIHLLPNPVPAPQGTFDETPADLSAICERDRLFLYPVRAVRRKNLGELLFWGALAPEDTWLANTLDPSNPNFRPAFDAWIEKAKALELPVVFELGSRTDASFDEIIARAETMVTTSVAEGFGLGFLEPWTFGKAVIGRDLPEITQDFKEEALHLDHLYARLDIPVDFVGDLGPLKEETRTHFAELREQYGEAYSEEDIDEIFETWIQNDHIDFGVLSEPFQESIIERVISERPAWAQKLADTFFGGEISSDAIESNDSIIRKSYTPQSYAETLLDIYNTLASARVERVLGHIDPRGVLSSFLSPTRFNLLRSS
ncbi:MAG: glycosyltransferase family 4 protein [Opitutales bacterium]